MAKTIKTFFDKDTNTLTYVVYDPATKDAVVIDPVWDYDPASSRLSSKSFSYLRSFLFEQELNLHYSLETHAHADHVTASQLVKRDFPLCKVGIGSGITEVQKTFKKIFNFDESFATDGRQFDLLINDGQKINAGSIEILALSTPGHTPACMSYLIEDCLFTGDTIFMPDNGTGRCDFPAGSASQLYKSIKEKIYSLPDHYKIFVGHDYMPNGRELKFECSVGDEKQNNIHLKGHSEETEFVAFRQARDKTLNAPRLLLPSIQININGGRLPEKENNGMAYIKLPILT